MAEVFKVNVKANLDAMTGDSRFTDVGEGETKIFRFAPSVVESGLIFYRTFNHYKLKNEDGRGVALADLGVHGTEETGTEDYIMRLSEVLQNSDNAGYAKIGKAIRGNQRFYAQGWEGFRSEDGTIKYSKIKLLALPKTAADAVLKIFKNQEMMNRPTGCDPDGGQAILVSREGTGFNTKYSADRSGIEESLDATIPGWKDQLFDDVLKAVKLNVYTVEEQKKIAQLTYPELDWEKLESEHGL